MNELQRLKKRSSFDTVKDLCKSAAALILLVLTVLLLLTEKAPDRFSSAFVRVVSATDGESLFKAFLGFIGSEEIETAEKLPEKVNVEFGKTMDEVLFELEGDGSSLELTPKDSFPIIEDDISNQNGKFEILIRNKSSKEITEDYLASLVSAEYPITASKSSEPLVLILHTHTTESYVDENTHSYVPANAVAETRSRSNSENVIAVGEVMKAVLDSMGIPTLHCTDYHDIYVFNESYDHSYQSVKSYLEMYPSIRYVIDLHRDSVIRTNGDKVCPVTEIDGQKAAQVMLVVGTDSSGLPHSKWEKNFTLALKLQKQMVDAYGTLARPVNLRAGRFNQQLCEGMLLLEVGSCGNTLSQAKYSARLVAYQLGKLINENL